VFVTGGATGAPASSDKISGSCGADTLFAGVDTTDDVFDLKIKVVRPDGSIASYTEHVDVSKALSTPKLLRHVRLSARVVEPPVHCRCRDHVILCVMHARTA
jgi:hypothetical protein